MSRAVKVAKGSVFEPNLERKVDNLRVAPVPRVVAWTELTRLFAGPGQVERHLRAEVL
jgi:hypothetical protein